MNFLSPVGILLFLFFSLAVSAHADTDLPTPLVETGWLGKNLDKVIILDVRTSKRNFLSAPVFEFDKKNNRQTLVRVGGHIPTARLIVYKHVRGDRQIDGRTIKHMAVSTEKFTRLMQRAGVDAGSNIVIATNAESSADLTMAARMYWQVKYFGHDQVAILNGGTAQWLIDGRRYTRHATPVDQGNWQVKTERASLLAGSQAVLAASKGHRTQLVDVRPLGQYLGTFKSSKVNASGHIPTAKTFPVDLLSSRRMPVKFSPAGQLTQLSDALGINPQQALISYCNSGHLAAGGWFVFHEILANKNVKLYDGSMHQWTLEERPVVAMKIE